MPNVNVAMLITKSNLEKVKALHNGALAKVAKIGKILAIYNPSTSEEETIAIFKKKNFEKEYGSIPADKTTWNFKVPE